METFGPHIIIETYRTYEKGKREKKEERSTRVIITDSHFYEENTMLINEFGKAGSLTKTNKIRVV